MENKDIKITLQYNLEEVNVLLSLLGALPFAQVASVIDNIRVQAVSQLPVTEKQDVEQSGDPDKPE